MADQEPPPTVPEASAAPERWGRVDTEGTVYLTENASPAGERAVGSWHAGEASEGLAHFARRFDDLRTEAQLLGTRLNTHAGDPKHTLSSARQLRSQLDDAAVVGDVAALATYLDYLVAKAENVLAEQKTAKQQARAEATARKEALVTEAEQLAAESTQWKSTGDRFRTMVDEWKQVRGVERKTDEQLWRRFAKARDTFSRRRGSHFAELDRQRAAAKTRKEELIGQAESLADSTDWAATATAFKQLMVEWKAAGRAPKDTDEALWQRFRSAQDRFFRHRSEALSARDAEHADNARLKEELLAEAEALDPETNPKAAQDQLHRLQQRWDSVGKVPRDRVRELEGKLKAVADRVRAANQAEWRRTDPEAQARLDQFRERVEQFETQAGKARAAGDEKRARQAEQQAEQWREWLTAAEQALASR